MIRTYDDPDPSAEAAPALTLPSLAEQNANAIRQVESRIDTLVAERRRINAEVLGLRGSLVALKAAHRHFVKLGAQLALPIVSGSAPLDEAPETGSGDTVMDDTDAALAYFGADVAGDGDTPVE